MEEKKRDIRPGLESRLPAIITTLALILMMAFMPSRIRIFPQWASYVCAIALLLPMIAVGIASDKRKWLRIERVVTLGFCSICGAVTMMVLAIVVRVILTRPADVTGLQLLSSSVAVWNINMLIFTLVYWHMDRGGTLARFYNRETMPDFHFPAQDLTGEVPSGWQPTFVDYLFLGFSVSTAFGMTEAAPITHRAKLLMMLQSSISLATIVVVGARAINVLGS